MPYVETPDFLNLGRYLTGLPGSKRFGPFFYGTSTLTVAAGAQGIVDVAQLKNSIYDTPFFVEQVLISVDGVSGGFDDDWDDVLFQIKPSSGPAWTNSFVPLQTSVANKGALSQNARTLPVPLPEPFPLLRGESVLVEFWNQGASSVDIIVGLVGYYETAPLYDKPRKIPWIIGHRLVQTIDTNTHAEFDSQNLVIDFDTFIAQHMNVIATGPTAGSVMIRPAITGRNKLVDALVPVASLRDPYTGLVPLFDTAVHKGESFEVEIENRDSSNDITSADCSIIGYRRAA